MVDNIVRPRLLLFTAMLVGFARAFVSSPRYPINHGRTRLLRALNLGSSSNLIQDNLCGPNDIFSTSPASAWIPSKLVGVIFDMDGTLLKPVIDFADMRRRIYKIASEDLGTVVDEGCVLEISSNRLSPEAQALANSVFMDIEQRAIENMQFEDGLIELCQWLDARNVRRAVLTRNVRRSVDAMHALLQDQHGISSFSPAVARDSCCQRGILLPPKPHPDAIQHICEEWQCHVSQVIMVGDSAADDIVAATRAGCGASVLLSKLGHDNNSGNDKDSKMEERIPTLTLQSLVELHELLLANMDKNQRGSNKQN